jgi:hypothetical protein
MCTTARVQAARCGASHSGVAIANLDMHDQERFGYQWIRVDGWGSHAWGVQVPAGLQMAFRYNVRLQPKSLVAFLTGRESFFTP